MPKTVRPGESRRIIEVENAFEFSGHGSKVAPSAGWGSTLKLSPYFGQSRPTYQRPLQFEPIRGTHLQSRNLF